MTYALELTNVSRHYGHTWALRDCTVSVRAGSITGLVGPNGAGKSTLLRIAAGLTRPTTGRVEVFGEPLCPAATAHLFKIGYLDQLRPTYPDFRVFELLRMGRRLNTTWNDDDARQYLLDWDIPTSVRVGTLSVGQQAQLALALCLAKRPQLLLLDEPLGSLDPLARQRVLQVLLATVVDHGMTVVLSSHIVGELEPVCDDIVIVRDGAAAFCGSLASLLATHHIVVCGRDGEPFLGAEVISSVVSSRQLTLLVRGQLPQLEENWQVSEPTLDEIVIAYLAGRQRASVAPAQWREENTERYR